MTVNPSIDTLMLIGAMVGDILTPQQKKERDAFITAWMAEIASELEEGSREQRREAKRKQDREMKRESLVNDVMAALERE